MVASVAHHLSTHFYFFSVFIIFIRGGGGVDGVVSDDGGGVLIHASTSTFLQFFLLSFYFYFIFFTSCAATHYYYYYYYFHSTQNIYMTHSSTRWLCVFSLLFFFLNTNFVYVHNFYLIYALSALALQTTCALLHNNKCAVPSHTINTVTSMNGLHVVGWALFVTCRDGSRSKVIWWFWMRHFKIPNRVFEFCLPSGSTQKLWALEEGAHFHHHFRTLFSSTSPNFSICREEQIHMARISIYGTKGIVSVICAWNIQ